jgi:hypothetical protein
MPQANLIVVDQVTLARHDSIFLQGSTSDVLYWVLSGLAKVYCPMPYGTRVLADADFSQLWLAFLRTRSRGIPALLREVVV